MTEPRTPAQGSGKQASADPWQAFGYLVSGVLLYGALGWLVDRWWGTSFVVAIGIVLGASFGLYMTIARFTAAERASKLQGRQDG